MKRLNIFLYIFIFLIAACNLPESKTINYGKPQDAVIKEIKELSGFEKVKISSRVSSIGDSATHTIRIYMENSSEEIKSDTALRESGRKAFNTLFKSIENEKEFTEFEAIFINGTDAGVIEYTEEKSFTYSFSELEE